MKFGSDPNSGSAPQVIVSSVQPVLTRWTEQVDHPRVLQRFGRVWDVGWEVDHITGPELVRLAVFPDMEPKAPLEDVCDLFMHVRVLRHNAAVAELHVRNHHTLAGHEPAAERRR